ncbi:MAG: T9SS type A sorting domain-containing protein, partial [Candidatus Marinimicrobia bacterium]|nr:T9SS type A sorting domain-containing protein [Candidatus Neomarinimicrobiota bacterium]
FSEFGYPTHSAWPNISLEKQAQYISRMYLSCLTDPQVKTVICYDLKNDGTNTAEAEHNFGILDFYANPKPSYHALRQLAARTGDARPDSSGIFSDRYSLVFGDSLNIVWSYSETQTCRQTLLSSFVRKESFLGDTLAYYIRDGDPVTLTLTESPAYLISQADEPQISELVFDHEDILLYPGDTVQALFSAKASGAIPLILSPSLLNWSLLGDCGTLGNGRFIASASGTGWVVAEFQGIRDTLELTVMEDPGIYTVESFDDTAGFRVESNVLLPPATHIAPETDGSRSTLAFHYEFSGTAAYAYLFKKILLNPSADSLFLDLKKDSNIHEIKIYCRDALRRSFILTLTPHLSDWQNGWGTLGAPMTALQSAAAPVSVEKFYLKIKPGAGVPTDPCTGTLLFDDLRMTRGVSVEIVSEPSLPRSPSLSQNYPNPFNGRCTIRFELPEASHVRLDILDIHGTVVSTPLAERKAAGSHRLDLVPDRLASGIYIYRLTTDRTSVSKKFLLIK